MRSWVLQRRLCRTQIEFSGEFAASAAISSRFGVYAIIPGYALQASRSQATWTEDDKHFGESTKTNCLRQLKLDHTREKDRGPLKAPDSATHGHYSLNASCLPRSEKTEVRPVLIIKATHAKHESELARHVCSTHTNGSSSLSTEDQTCCGGFKAARIV
ncbi:hypothetical protein BP00DRAFT_278928 [Aspergillus indologenus CBS 114.80]|uniref:Uncharacterized protein n=1 Tax=Aspergillus indologenus CBS 114.80 TaxID=1450541 RepID=A0A2V5HYH8_9EURO|nr:hypothetical protein BP00DRAFT_278928 [Aspergillus indologenus CBS 114.80]